MDRLARLCVQQNYGRVRATYAHGKFPSIGTERQETNFLATVLTVIDEPVLVEFDASIWVPDPRVPFGATSREQAVGAERCPVNDTLMSQDVAPLARRRVPDSHGHICAGRGQKAPVRVE